jgi:hypothetical protein
MYATTQSGTFAVVQRTCDIAKQSTALIDVLNSTGSEITIQIKDVAIHVKPCSIYDPSASSMIFRK